MKRFAIVLTALIFTTTVSAVELDFRATGATEFLEGAQTTSGAADIVLSRRFTQDQTLTLRVEGTVDNAGALDLFLRELTYRGDFPQSGRTGVLSLTAGRTQVSDVSGLIAPLTVDGLIVGWRIPGLVLQGVAATTALLRPQESLLLTATDQSEAGALLGPQRYVGGVFLTLPETFGTANLYAHYLTQLDGRALLAPPAGAELYTSHYLVTGVIAPLASRLFASGFLYGNLGINELVGSGTTTYLGYGARAEVRSFLPVSGRPVGTASVLFASGDNEGALSATPSGELTTLFAPGPYATPWTLAQVPLANVIAGTLSGSFLPFDWSDDPAVRRTQLSARTTALYRPWSIDPGAAGVDPSATGGWYGTELAATLVLKPFTDLDIRGTGAIFLPVRSDNGGVYAASTRGSWRVSVEATLVF